MSSTPTSDASLSTSGTPEPTDHFDAEEEPTVQERASTPPRFPRPEGRQNWKQSRIPFNYPDDDGCYDTHYTRCSFSHGHGSQMRWLQITDDTWDIGAAEDIGIHILPVAEHHNPALKSHFTGEPLATEMSRSLQLAHAGALRVIAALVLEQDDNPKTLKSLVPPLNLCAQFLLREAVDGRKKGDTGISGNLEGHAENEGTEEERTVLLAARDQLDGLEKLGAMLDKRSDGDAVIIWRAPEGSNIGNASFYVHPPPPGTLGGYYWAEIWYPDDDDESGAGRPGIGQASRCRNEVESDKEADAGEGIVFADGETVSFDDVPWVVRQRLLR